MDYNQQPQDQQQYQWQHQQQQYQQPLYQAPQSQLPADRNIVVVILLTFVTFGIYGIVLRCKLANELNETASRADGKHTTHFLACVLLSCITFGIYGLVWNHKFAERVGNEAARRNTGISFSAADYWIWSFLLSFTVICPFIYQYKLLEATNAINASYNIYG